MADLVAKYSPEQRRRLKARPGITGYQQVIARGIPLSEGVQYDLIYLKNQSLLLDLYILIRTAVIVVAGRGVTH
jgi:lipopolysaccharide/colanic/teichoic acid biosynthesis glycosyltransferase